MRGRGQLPHKKKKIKKIKKINVFGQKIEAILAKKITRILFIPNVFFWMITPEMNIIYYQFNLTSWLFFFIENDENNQIKHVSHAGLCLFTNV